MRGQPDEQYITVNSLDLCVGDEVIVESKHFEYKTGVPTDSEYYRAVVGEHRTVSGLMKHLVSEPTFNWPSIPSWQSRWIYAGNSETQQMWKKVIT